jgi:hypothetical protein
LSTIVVRRRCAAAFGVIVVESRPPATIIGSEEVAVFALLSSWNRAVRAFLSAHARPGRPDPDLASLGGTYAGCDPTGYRDRSDRF